MKAVCTQTVTGYIHFLLSTVQSRRHFSAIRKNSYMLKCWLVFIIVCMCLSAKACLAWVDWIGVQVSLLNSNSFQFQIHKTWVTKVCIPNETELLKTVSRCGTLWLYRVLVWWKLVKNWKWISQKKVPFNPFFLYVKLCQDVYKCMLVFSAMKGLADPICALKVNG